MTHKFVTKCPQSGQPILINFTDEKQREFWCPWCMSRFALHAKTQSGKHVNTPEHVMAVITQEDISSSLTRKLGVLKKQLQGKGAIEIRQAIIALFKSMHASGVIQKYEPISQRPDNFSAIHHS